MYTEMELRLYQLLGSQGVVEIVDDRIKVLFLLVNNDKENLDLYKDFVKEKIQAYLVKGRMPDKIFSATDVKVYEKNKDVTFYNYNLTLTNELSKLITNRISAEFEREVKDEVTLETESLSFR